VRHYPHSTRSHSTRGEEEPPRRAEVPPLWSRRGLACTVGEVRSGRRSTGPGTAERPPCCNSLERDLPGRVASERAAVPPESRESAFLGAQTMLVNTKLALVLVSNVTLVTLGSCATAGPKAATGAGAGPQISVRLERPPQPVSVQANVWEFRAADPITVIHDAGAEPYRPYGPDATVWVIPMTRVEHVYRQMRASAGYAMVRSNAMAQLTRTNEWVTLDGDLPDKAGAVVPGHRIRVSGFADSLPGSAASPNEPGLIVDAEWTLPEGTVLKSGRTPVSSPRGNGCPQAVVLLAKATPDGVHRMTVLFASFGPTGTQQTAPATAQGADELRRYYRDVDRKLTR
jgi:hypothetical protein